MRPMLNNFCCLTPLRSGCYVIGFFLIISASLYLIGFFIHQGTNDTNDNVKAKIIRLATTISLIGSAFNYIIATILLTGVYKDLMLIILGSSILLILYTLSQLSVAAYVMYIGSVPHFIALLMYAAMKFYFTIVVFSYYLERKEEKLFLASLDEEMRANLARERIQAKQLGGPDPIKAALMKYREYVDDEEEEEDRTEDLTSSQPSSKN